MTIIELCKYLVRLLSIEVVEFGAPLSFTNERGQDYHELLLTSPLN